MLTSAKVFIISLIVLLLNAPLVAHANAPIFRINSVEVDINVQADGSVHVTERVTYQFQSSANGVFMDIDFRGYGTLENARVSVITQNSAMLFTKTDRASVGDSGVYTLSMGRNVASFQVFSPAQRGDIKTFVYSYTLTEGAFLYENTAVFQRVILGHGWDVDIESFAATFTTPGSEPEAAVFYRNIPAGFGVALGRHFLPQLLPDAPLREGVWENEPATGLVAPEPPNNTAIFIVLGFGGGIFAIIVVVIAILARPYPTEFKERYYRSLPSQKSPALVSYLVNHKTTKSCDIVATLLYLVQCGVLDVENDSTFIVMDKKLVELSSYEQFLIDWLFIETEHGLECHLEDINEMAANEKSAELFYADYIKWQKLVSQEAARLNLFESYFRRTQHAQEEYVKWVAFRRHIKSVTSGKSFEVPPTSAEMEQFLPYLIALGLSKTAIQISSMADYAADNDFIFMLAMANTWNMSVQQAHSNGYTHTSDSSSASFSSGGGGGSGGGAF